MKSKEVLKTAYETSQANKKLLEELREDHDNLKEMVEDMDEFIERLESLVETANESAESAMTAFKNLCKRVEDFNLRLGEMVKQLNKVKNQDEERMTFPPDSPASD